MAPLEFLLGWYEGWVAAGGGRLEVRFGSSQQGLPKRSAWVEVEGLHRAGQLTVWESGETEVEVNDITSVDLVFSRSGKVETSEELADLLAELLREVDQREA